MATALLEKGETMTDYIKREDAMRPIIAHDPLKDLGDSRGYAEWLLNKAPSADVAPVRHGRWEVVDAEEPRRYGCSECKRLSWNMDNYCPNCGAKMDGGDE